MMQYGVILHLIGFADGVLAEIKHLEAIQELPSVLKAEMYVSIGDEVSRTVDIRSDVGYVLMCSADKNSLDNDVQKIVCEVQKDMLVVISVKRQ